MTSDREATEDATQDEVEVEPAGSGEEVERDLDALLADVTRERDEYLDLAQRARADFDNYRRRSAKDAAESEVRGKASLARAILPAIDNLDRAIQAVGYAPTEEDPTEPESREVSANEALTAGVALVRDELARALAAAGVEAFDPAGEAFDPTACEAISTRPAADGEGASTVVETLERGYRIGETLIRPARVVVAS